MDIGPFCGASTAGLDGSGSRRRDTCELSCDWRTGWYSGADRGTLKVEGGEVGAEVSQCSERLRCLPE